MTENPQIQIAIMQLLKKASTPITSLNAKDVPGFPEQEVAYNMMLLKKAGYIEATILLSPSGDGGIQPAIARGLKLSGYKLLDKLLNKSVQSKDAKKIVD